jgi:hypothetical protein
MRRFSAAVAIAAVLSFGGWVSMVPARSAPPTVTPSPGYDARLQEQRNASTFINRTRPLAIGYPAAT